MTFNVILSRRGITEAFSTCGDEHRASKSLEFEV